MVRRHGCGMEDCEVTSLLQVTYVNESDEPYYNMDRIMFEDHTKMKLS